MYILLPLYVTLNALRVYGVGPFNAFFPPNLLQVIAQKMDAVEWPVIPVDRVTLCLDCAEPRRALIHIPLTQSWPRHSDQVHYTLVQEFFLPPPSKGAASLQTYDLCPGRSGRRFERRLQ